MRHSRIQVKHLKDIRPPLDISNAMAFLCSDDARYITGETLAVAAGFNASNAG